MEYRFCKPLGLIWVTARSVVTAETMRAFHRKLLDDPEIPPGQRELMDLRNLDIVAVDAKVVQEIAAVEAARAERIGAARIAVVASQPVAHGLGRMYESLAGGTQKKVSVFSEVGPALKWLGITPDELKQHLPEVQV